MPSCHTPSRENLPHCIDQISLAGLSPEPTALQLTTFLVIVLGGAALVGWLAGASAFRTWPFNSTERE